MKYLYTFFVIALFSCKTEKKQEIIHNNNAETEKTDTYANVENLNERQLIGKVYQNLDEFEEFKNYRYGGFELLVACEEKK